LGGKLHSLTSFNTVTNNSTYSFESHVLPRAPGSTETAKQRILSVLSISVFLYVCVSPQKLDNYTDQKLV